ncbi:hypothetical protein Hanom_Chr06g00488861 [Helianthus anomalus]
MHIRNDPSFFLTKRTGAPQGEVLGRIKPFSSNFWSWFDSSRISDGASRYGALAIGLAPGMRSMRKRYHDLAVIQGDHQGTPEETLGPLGRL